jgi:surface antigen
MTRLSSIAALLACGVALGACQNSNVGLGQGVGTVGGAVAGGLIGNEIGGGSGRIAATIAGAALGGLLGGALGSQFDERDREIAQQAQLRAVSRGRSTSWRGQNSDAYGSVEPGEIYTSNTGNCREYTHTIFIGGRPKQGRGTACQNEQGDWEIVS